MTTGRDAFLQRVRQAVRVGNRSGAPPALPQRDLIGEPGAGADPVARFCETFTAAGGTSHVVADREAAATTVIQLVRSRQAMRILLGRGDFLDALQLPDRLAKLGLSVTRADWLAMPSDRDNVFAADLGISGVHALVAETGSLVVVARPTEPRSLTLLPPIHIAIACRAQLTADLFDVFRPPLWPAGVSPPSCVTLITGPSKTGDIELRLVTGVHGPGEIHVVLCTGE
jgi:L-lactate utilization protein LutC